MRTAAALIIGNELLSGKIAEANLLVLARVLRGVGVQLRRVVMILDEKAVIADEVKRLSSTHDFLFTSGGVGPTHDDVTIEAVADAFGARVVASSVMEQMLRAYYKGKVTEGHLLMARIPEGARLASSDQVPWPTVVMRNVWVLPGVPEVFQMKMPLVERELSGDAPFVSRAVFTTLDEGQLKPMLDQVVARFAGVAVGSSPKWGGADYRTKLPFDGTDGRRVAEASAAFVEPLPPDPIVRT